MYSNIIFYVLNCLLEALLQKSKFYSSFLQLNDTCEKIQFLENYNIVHNNKRKVDTKTLYTSTHLRSSCTAS